MHAYSGVRFETTGLFKSSPTEREIAQEDIKKPSVMAINFFINQSYPIVKKNTFDPINEPNNNTAPPQNKEPVIFVSAIPCKPLKYKSFNKKIK